MDVLVACPFAEPRMHPPNDGPSSLRGLGDPLARRVPRSIRWQLPVGIAVILFVVVASFSVFAYLEVRNAEVEQAEAELRGAADRLASLVHQTTDQRLEELRELAVDPGLPDALAGTDTVRALRELEGFVLPRPSVLSVELWAVDRSLVLEVRSVPRGSLGPAAAGFPVWAADEDEEIDGIHGDPRGQPWFALAVALRDGDGQRLGYLVERRRIASDPATGRIIAELIGPEAVLLLGEPGGTWTNLRTVVVGPPPDLLETGALVEYEREGEGRMAVAGRVPDTSWVMWVEFPTAGVAERAHTFLVAVFPLGLLVVGIGAFAGWLLSRGVTARLARITAGAREVAAGGTPRPVPVGRTDELGELAAAFNIMTRRVEDGRRELEARVAERTSELEAANRELEAFSYSVSHDLRAPLRSIAGFGRVLREDYHEVLEGAGADHIERIQAATDRMGGLIDGLLDLSRVTRQELRRVEVDLSAKARQIARELGLRDRSRRVELTIQEELQAEGDPRLLALVLENLLENAWKFSAGEEIARIHFGAEDGEEGRVFFVRDNGVGFDMRHAGQLFSAFQRLHRKGEFSGAGIGLATVQRIVHRHGGEVWAEGRTGEGATFYFTL